MKLNQTDILFASLVGSKVAKTIPRYKVLENELGKRVLPPVDFLLSNNETQLKGISDLKESEKKEFQTTYSDELWQADRPTPYEKQFFPFSFVGEDGNKYLLPYEPMISISGKNTIIRRNVAKINTKDGNYLRGSIKERWTQDDYEITITGALFGSIITGNVEDCYPRDHFKKLRDFMTAPKSLKIECEPLQLLDIHRIVIEDFSFPFSKGENVQAYEIKAYSDFDYKLLLDIND